MKRLITCLAAVGLCASLALADHPPVTTATPQPVAAKTVQRVTPDLKAIGPVYTLDGGIAAKSTTLAYDAFEPTPPFDVDFPPPGDGHYGVNCGLGGNRYLFTGTYHGAQYVDDMKVCPGAENAKSDRTEFLWSWQPPAGSETCFIFLFTTEDFDQSCVGPPFSTGYDGVRIGFGVLPKGFWYTDVDVQSNGLFWQLPQDGSGGTYFIQSQGFTSTTIFLATQAGAGMWGTKDPSATPPGTNCSSTTKIMWIDDNPQDGTFDPATECYDMSGSQCPSPLANAICFYWQGGPPPGVRCDANCDGVFDGADIDPFFAALANPNQWKIDHPNCDFLTHIDANNDGVVDGADIDAFFKGLSQGHCPPT